jgi:hypothetical protein
MPKVGGMIGSAASFSGTRDSRSHAFRMKNLAASILAVLILAATGCVYGPDHLPALYQQRDHFQTAIDDVLVRMAADKQWWSSLSPERRKYWKDYLEKIRFDERERALDALNSITEAEGAAESGSREATGAGPP